LSLDIFHNGILFILHISSRNNYRKEIILSHCKLRKFQFSSNNGKNHIYTLQSAGILPVDASAGKLLQQPDICIQKQYVFTQYKKNYLRSSPSWKKVQEYKHNTSQIFRYQTDKQFKLSTGEIAKKKKSIQAYSYAKNINTK